MQIILFKPLYLEYSLSGVTDDQIGMLAMQNSINPEIEKALRNMVAKKGVVADLDLRLKTEQKNVDQIFTDQGRLRENMKALKGSAEEKALLQRYTKQLDDEETRLETGQKVIQEIQTQRDKSNDDLQKSIQELQMDVVL